jgi:hypothetical protein
MSAENPPQNAEGRIVNISGVAGGSTGVIATISLSTRPYMSTYHLRAADLFCSKSGSIEDEYAGRPWEEAGDAKAEHRAYVTGAIFACVAFLEATINELFTDAATDLPPSNVPAPAQQLPADVKRLLGDTWRTIGERALRTLNRYQLALILARSTPFDQGTNPYQDCSDLIFLRNDLIHYTPRDIEAGLQPGEETEKFARRLRAKGFELNRLLPEGSGNPFYPDKSLSHGCARWAFNSSLRFSDEFHIRLGVKPKYDGFRPFDCHA